MTTAGWIPRADEMRMRAEAATHSLVLRSMVYLAQLRVRSQRGEKLPGPFLSMVSGRLIEKGLDPASAHEIANKAAEKLLAPKDDGDCDNDHDPDEHVKHITWKAGVTIPAIPKHSPFRT